MNKTVVAMILLGVAFALTAATAQADLVLHWKLDELTGPNYMEEVSGLSLAAELPPVTEGLPGLAPDGGTAFGFTRDDPDYRYVDAGTLQSDGTYVAGSDPDYQVLNGDWTLAIWFNWSSGTITMWSSDFTGESGWATHVIGGEVIHGFGNLTVNSGLMTQEGTDYLLVISRRTSDATDLPGTGEVSGDRHVFALYDKAAETWSYSYGTESRNIRLQGIALGTRNDNFEWVGTLDDPRIYDHVLTQEELVSLSIPTYVWDRAPSSPPLWSDAGGWSPVGVPGADDHVQFLCGSYGLNVFLQSDQACNSIAYFGNCDWWTDGSH